LCRQTVEGIRHRSKPWNTPPWISSDSTITAMAGNIKLLKNSSEAQGVPSGFCLSIYDHWDFVSSPEESYSEGMPELSRFFGIVIGVFYREHGRPHFHAVYGEFEAVIDIETGGVIEGELPKRALSLISEWQNAHMGELRENWERARQHKELKKIPPLE
jgi:hypothetical protein